MPINRFRGEYFFLSNFYPCVSGVLYDGDEYPTSEHAYQAAKIEDRQGRESFTSGGSLGPNPMHAKRKGGKVKKRSDWDAMKVDVMLEVVRSKFARDCDLQEALLKTQNQHIVEGHTGDKFWGGTRNHLGNILMRVREELRTQHRQAITQPSADDEVEIAEGKQKQPSKGNANADAFRLHISIEEAERQCEVAHSCGSDNESCDAGDEADLPSGFKAWLSSALKEELSASDAINAMCTAEVILLGAVQDPSVTCELLESAANTLIEEYGAESVAAQLASQWFTHAPS